MSERPASPEATVRYLLDTMTESEREDFEGLYFGNAEALESIDAIESDLIDSYLRDELSGEKREQFEKAYLSNPARLEKVEFAKSLHQFIEQKGSEGGRAKPQPAASSEKSTRLLLIAAVLALVGVSTLFFYESSLSRRELRNLSRENARLRGQQATLQAENARLREVAGLSRSPIEGRGPSPSPQDLAKPTEPPMLVASLVLRGGLTRGEGSAQSLVISSRTTLVRVTVPVEALQYRALNVTIEKPDGRSVLRQEGLKAQDTAPGRAVILEIPAARFSSGDYVLTLRGIAPDGQERTIGGFFFQVIRR